MMRRHHSILIRRTTNVGVDVTLTPAELNEHPMLLERLKALRRKADELMGVTGSAAIPRVACVAPGVGAPTLCRRAKTRWPASRPEHKSGPPKAP